MSKILTTSELYQRYMALHNDGKLTHLRAYNECNIDKNTFTRLRKRYFLDIKYVDFLNLANLVTKLERENNDS